MQIYHVLEQYSTVVQCVMSPFGISQQHQFCKEFCSAHFKAGHLTQHPLLPDVAHAGRHQPHQWQFQGLRDLNIQKDNVLWGNSWAVAGNAGKESVRDFFAKVAGQ